MDEKKKIERERLLLVEGKTDKEFFDRLCMNQLGDDYVTNLQILPYDGKDSLKSFLEVLLTLPKFEEVTHLGIVRDADFTGGALASIQGILRQLPQLQQYSNSIRHNQFTGTNPSIGIFIMPNGKDLGMLETLVLDALKSIEEETSNVKPIMRCVEDYFNCLDSQGVIPKQERSDKAQLVIYQETAELKIRTYMAGQNVDENSQSRNTKLNEAFDLYRIGWWSWDVPIFDEVKAFIKQLTE